ASYVRAHAVFGNAARLATLDTTSLQITVVGTYDLLTGGADATGTGDSRLFGFFRSNPVTIAEVDKSNAKILGTAHPGVQIGSAWAFAFWGGSFWLFTKNGLAL